MGYEVKYFYHEKVEGKYNYETTKELKKKIGSPTDDTPLEQVAAAVLAQMARRDILVVDVEIHEFTKKKINFKPSDDGMHVIIKGKKFSLDKAANIVAQDQLVGDPEEAVTHHTIIDDFEEPVEEVVDEGFDPGQFDDEFVERALQTKPKARPAAQTAVKDNKRPDFQTALQRLKANKEKAAGNKNLAPPPPVNQTRLLYWVEFDPNPRQELEAKKQKWRLSKGRRYPVHRSRDDETRDGMLLSISDDQKKVLEIHEQYFTVCGVGLVGEEEGIRFQDPVGQPRAKLMYEDQMKADPHNIPVARPTRPTEIPEHLRHIPIDGQEGGIPEELFHVPDIRPNRAV